MKAVDPTGDAKVSAKPADSARAAAVPTRPDRGAVTHPERPAPHPQPFADLVRQMLAALGEDPGREGLLKTPERVEAALRFLTQGYWQSVEDAVGDAVFEESHQSMIMVRDIELYSLCEHHLLPFFGRAHVAYIPAGKILGLSKVARIVDVFARRLQVQERLTDQIADAIMEVINPAGVGVVVEAAHFCMMMRGVEKQNSRTVTSALRGIFRDDPRTRDEFIRLAHNRLVE
ncbi:MAG TPA: GTP cyclohydrolase I FolE [Gemmatimonadales bacterium]|nr:GTP cyclohydrolase I FolE [Gemmatimonadales bacterium]